MKVFERNTKTRLELPVPGTELAIPATLVDGEREGAVCVISAGVHSREYVGMLSAMELAKKLEPEKTAGRVLILHCCNYSGFIARSPDTVPEDGMDLNRVFPGDGAGSPAQRLAAYLGDEITDMADYMIDLHSGGCFEELIPHVYFPGAASDKVNAASEEMARHVDAPYIVRSAARHGFYSNAAHRGVPAIILERGGRGLWTTEEVESDTRDVLNILRHLGLLLDGEAPVLRSPRLLACGHYEASPESGCWFPMKRPGDSVRRGEALGEIRDIYGELVTTVTAKDDGVILYQTCTLAIERGAPMIAYAGNAAR